MTRNFSNSLGACSSAWALEGAAGAVEDLAVVEVEEVVQACGPVLHGHGDLPSSAGLGQVEESVDQAAEVAWSTRVR